MLLSVRGALLRLLEGLGAAAEWFRWSFYVHSASATDHLLFVDMSPSLLYGSSLFRDPLDLRIEGQSCLPAKLEGQAGGIG